MTPRRLLSACLLSITLISFQADGMLKQVAQLGIQRFLPTFGTPLTARDFSTSKIFKKITPPMDRNGFEREISFATNTITNMSKEILKKVIEYENFLNSLKERHEVIGLKHMDPNGRMYFLEKIIEIERMEDYSEDIILAFEQIISEEKDSDL